MQTTVVGWAMGVGVVAVACLALRRVFTGRTVHYDAGAVSEGWVTAHRADREPMS